MVPVFLSGAASILKACGAAWPESEAGRPVRDLKSLHRPASAGISLGLVDGWNAAMAVLRWLSWIWLMFRTLEAFIVSFEQNMLFMLCSTKKSLQAQPSPHLKSHR
jgi:hypothetical protein